jgi:hypothetical protein
MTIRDPHVAAVTHHFHFSSENIIVVHAENYSVIIVVE